MRKSKYAISASKSLVRLVNGWIDRSLESCRSVYVMCIGVLEATYLNFWLNSVADWGSRDLAHTKRKNVDRSS